MKVAVAYNNGQIGEHFGHAECFAIYDYQDTNGRFLRQEAHRLH